MSDDRRPPIRKHVRMMVFERDRFRCVYCGYYADQLDHVVPYRLVREHSYNNLVSSCSFCNAVAAGREFRTVETKREYIRAVRTENEFWRVQYARRKKDDIARCADCGVPYRQRACGSTILLCRDCIKKDVHGKVVQGD